jgi:hypothetical protein|tara:strand:+ start:497 stop:1027 length:531 start_codon:yes stop_codon:yes gene_type:complete
MAGLQFIHKETISGSTSTTNVTSCFTSDYDVYKIYSTGISTAGTDYVDLNMRLIDSGGSVISDNEYNYANLNMLTWTSFTETSSENQSSFLRAFSESTDQAPESQGGEITVYNPNSSSSYTFITYANSQKYGGSYMTGLKGIGVHTVAETITGFQLLESNGSRPYSSGVILVYGVK